VAVVRIYLDHNATTPMDPRVLEAMLGHLAGSQGNPSSPHTEGRAARRAVEDAREAVASLLGVPSREIVFTSGATEANNFALKGMTPAGGRLAISAIEHPSVRECAHRLGTQGVAVTDLPVDGAGVLDLDVLDQTLRDGVDVVAVMAANNEFGTLQPWEEIATRCRNAGAALHVDAVQMVGKVPFTTPDPGRGSVALSGHKVGGPKGVGALWIRTDTRVAPLVEGGGQERLRRAGTENVAGIVGFGVACRLAREEVMARHRGLQAAEDAFLGALRARGLDFVRHGPTAATQRLPGTLNLRFPGVPGEQLLLSLDLAGVAISLGSACSSGAVQPSHALAALGINRVDNLESVRISLHWDHAAGVLEDAVQRIATVLEHNPR